MDAAFERTWTYSQRVPQGWISPSVGTDTAIPSQVWYPVPPLNRRKHPVHPMLNIAVRAARAAGNVIVRYANRLDELTVTSKDQHDFVSEVDREAEARIIQVLRKAYPRKAASRPATTTTSGSSTPSMAPPTSCTASRSSPSPSA